MSSNSRSIFAGFFTVACLLTAFLGSQYFDTKEHYFAPLVSVFAILWYIRQLLTKPTQLSVTPLDIAIAVLIFYFLANSLLVSHFTIDCLSVLLLLCCLTTWISGRGLSRLPEFAPVVVFLVLLSGIVQALWGILQQFAIIPRQHAFKIIGSFQNPGVYANYLAGIFPLALAMVLQQKGRIKKILFVVGMVFVAVCIFILPFTMARTAWLGSMVGMSVVMEYRYGWFAKIFCRGRRLLSTIFISAVIIIFMIIGVALYHLKPGSAQGRLLIYKITAGIVMEHPFTGTGFQTFSKNYNLHQANYFASGSGNETEQWLASCIRIAFNDYLQIAAETGVVGLLLMLSIGYILIHYRNRMHTSYTQGAAGSIASLACCALFSYPFQEISIIALTGLMLLIISGKTRHLLWLPSIRIHRLIIIVILITTSILCYFSLIGLQSVYRWKNAASETTIHAFNVAQQIKYAQLYPNLENNPYFLYNYGMEYLLTKKYNQSIPMLLQTSQYLIDTDIACCLGDAYKGAGQHNKAEKFYRLAANMAPNKFYPLYCLVKLYRKTGDEIKAVDMANIIVHKKEKVRSYTTYKIIVEMRQMIDSLSIKNHISD